MSEVYQDSQPGAGGGDEAGDKGKGKQQSASIMRIRGEYVKMGEEHEIIQDIYERDPYRTNEDLKVTFQDIFGEPDAEIYSFDKIWTCSSKVFSGTKLWCYRLTSLILGVPLALICGFNFACLSFWRIWLCMPLLRTIKILMFIPKSIWEIILDAFVRPFFDAVSHCLSSIRVNVQKTNDPKSAAERSPSALQKLADSHSQWEAGVGEDVP